MNTDTTIFDRLDEHEKINKLKAEVKKLKAISKEHKKLVGKQYKEIDRLAKDMALVKEDNQLLNIEIGRLMEKISKKTS
jgi:regulator of replication initiation timing